MAATASIIPTKNIFGLLLAGGGVLLVLCGVPAFISGLIILPTEATRDRLYTHNNLTPAETEAFARNRAAAQRFWPSAKMHDDMAMAALRHAEANVGDFSQFTQLLRAVEKRQTTNLALQPANPFGWARLAYVRGLLYGPSILVTLPLEKSIQTGLYEPDLMVSRATLLMNTQKFHTPYLREVFERQMITAWDWQVTRFALTQAAIDGGWIDQLYALYGAKAPSRLPELKRVEQAVYWRMKKEPPAR
ncbi:MAG: hypothetical protein EBZ69_09960 [Alphaproteobacteria bacterium]|nr:hypothetical protein [Alphaproteobacteria bacterium]NDC57108.1 hypothetical protein [Alphaproteobacteria bacterium]NDG04777.1 hypothetical protein [Alphaproteobacteria bacterium]